MIGILFKGEGELEVTDVPEPALGIGDVKIATGISGICGTDLHSFGKKGEKALHPPATVPPGHEIAGTVVEVGEGVNGLRVGDRVVGNHIVGCGLCEMCHAGAPHFCPTRQRVGRELSGTLGQYVVVPERNVIHLPDGLSFEAGVLLACNFGTAYSALRRAGVSGDHTVAVFGLGPVGLCLVMAARGLGAQVIAVEPNERRRSLALELVECVVLDPTATDVVPTVLEQAGGRGVEVAVDATGVETAQNQALDVTRPQGTMIFIGVGGDTTISPFRQLIGKDLTVLGSYTYKLHEFESMFSFVRRTGIVLDRLVTATFPPGDAAAAFALTVSGAPGKIVFDWTDVNGSPSREASQK